MRMTQHDILEYLKVFNRSNVVIDPDTRIREVFIDNEQAGHYPLLFAQLLLFTFPIGLLDRQWLKVLRKELPIDEDWDLESINWKDVSEQATFGELTDAFLKRIPAPQFKPLNICFQNCRSAGVFEDLRSLGRLWEEHYGVQITPSTRLNKAIGNGSMEFFWKRLQLYLNNRLPETRNCFSYLWFRCGYFGALAGVCLSVLFVVFGLLPDYFSVILPVMFLGLVYLGVRLSLYHWAPAGITTFRDLSILIADTIDGKRVSRESV